jgi:DMSO/TMAO reductase YedYZ heme-binding membrane subunit
MAQGENRVTVLAASGPSPLWYLSRGTGAVALLLLTVSVVLGILDQRHWRPAGWPRFVLDALHRNVSLLVLALLAVHIASSVIDTFAPIRLVDAFVPFVSAYRPVWVGLGALAFDLLLAVLITSVLRRYLGHRAWRMVHWLAYVSWPVAVVHGLTTGTDVKAAWLLALTATCAAAVVIATGARVIAANPAPTGRRTAALASLVLAPVVLAFWLPKGPLGEGWARRAGTPADLLGSAPTAGVAARSAKGTLPVPFVARLTGTATRGQTASGLSSVDLSMRFRGQADGTADVFLEGQALPGGGIQMTASRATLGPSSDPSAYRGRVVALNGNRIVASMKGPDSRSLRVGIDVAIAQDSSLSGTITGPAGSAATR